ncbi:MAG: LamG domain-containing protein [Gammaproteobacteria bacterium]
MRFTQGFLAAALFLVGAPTHAFEYSDAVLAKNPIAYWRLGETSGTTAYDSVGDYHGTYEGDYTLGNPGVFTAEGDSDAAVQSGNGANGWWSSWFGADIGHVEIAHDEAFLLDEGTVSLWFNADAHAYFGNGLFSKDSNGFDDGGHLNIYTGSGNRVYARLQSDTTSYQIASDTDSFQLNEWVHLAFSFGAQGMKLYLDGELIGTNAYSGGLLGNLEPIALGANAGWSGDGTVDPLYGGFSGLLDEFSIFDRALSAADIQDLYTGVNTTVADVGVPTPSPLLLIALLLTLVGGRAQLWKLSA